MSTIEARNLTVAIGGAPVVDAIDMTAGRADWLGIVGESGSGKTMTALALMGLTPPVARVSADSLSIEGQDVAVLNSERRRDLLGRVMTMVFQDPMVGLNPVRSVGSLLVETIRRHQSVTIAAARGRAIQALTDVGIPAAAARFGAYPHELSGGMRQRVMIALALVNRPALLIADEPTTALDVTIQAQILALLREKLSDAALILITHDIGVAADLCHRIAVMYHGRIVEEGPAAALAARPLHPYTQGLLAAMPHFDAQRPRLIPIPGAPPSAHERIMGCAFAARCPKAADICRNDTPTLRVFGDRKAACHFPDAT